MRVNNNRLDLGSLTVGIDCTVITGTSLLTLEHRGCGSIQMGMRFRGGDPLAAGAGIVKKEQGRNGSDLYWFDLTALRPSSLYRIRVTGSGVPTWLLGDETPGRDLERPARAGWLSRLLGKGERK